MHIMQYDTFNYSTNKRAYIMPFIEEITVTNKYYYYEDLSEDAQTTAVHEYRGNMERKYVPPSLQDIQEYVGFKLEDAEVPARITDLTAVHVAFGDLNIACTLFISRQGEPVKINFLVGLLPDEVTAQVHFDWSSCGNPDDALCQAAAECYAGVKSLVQEYLNNHREDFMGADATREYLEEHPEVLFQEDGTPKDYIY